MDIAVCYLYTNFSLFFPPVFKQQEYLEPRWDPDTACVCLSMCVHHHLQLNLHLYWTDSSVQELCSGLGIYVNFRTSIVTWISSGILRDNTVRDNRLLLMIYAFVIVYRIRKHARKKKLQIYHCLRVLTPSFLSTSGSERWTRRHYWCKLAHLKHIFIFILIQQHFTHTFRFHPDVLMCDYHLTIQTLNTIINTLLCWIFVINYMI